VLLSFFLRVLPVYLLCCSALLYCLYLCCCTISANKDSYITLSCTWRIYALSERLLVVVVVVTGWMASDRTEPTNRRRCLEKCEGVYGKWRHERRQSRSVTGCWTSWAVSLYTQRFHSFLMLLYHQVIVRSLSTVEYTSVASVFHSRLWSD